MRDTSDMMNDAMSEDTMMDCSNDEVASDDLVNLAADISNSSATIQDAAERLLTLLGVEDSDDDFISSSEDEGVELDSEDNEDEEDRRENIRLLHQLANSLTQELKYSQKQSFLSKHAPGRSKGPQDQIQCMELGQEFSNDGIAESPSFVKFDTSLHEHSMHPCNSPNILQTSFDECGARKRFKIDEEKLRIISDKTILESSSSSSWDSGWNACANEAVRYLIEEEGLPPHHPTVLGLKNHLFMQRDKAFTQYLV